MYLDIHDKTSRRLILFLKSVRTELKRRDGEDYEIKSNQDLKTLFDEENIEKILSEVKDLNLDKTRIEGFDGVVAILCPRTGTARQETG